MPLLNEVPECLDDGLLLFFGGMPRALFHDLNSFVEKYRQAARQLTRDFRIVRPKAEHQMRPAEYAGGSRWQAPAPEDRRAAVKEV
jgi:hypothetical protein